MNNNNRNVLLLLYETDNREFFFKRKISIAVCRKMKIKNIVQLVPAQFYKLRKKENEIYSLSRFFLSFFFCFFRQKKICLFFCDNRIIIIFCYFTVFFFFPFFLPRWLFFLFVCFHLLTQFIFANST